MATISLSSVFHSLHAPHSNSVGLPWAYSVPVSSKFLVAHDGATPNKALRVGMRPWIHRTNKISWNLTAFNHHLPAPPCTTHLPFSLHILTSMASKRKRDTEDYNARQNTSSWWKWCIRFKLKNGGQKCRQSLLDMQSSCTSGWNCMRYARTFRQRDRRVPNDPWGCIGHFLGKLVIYVVYICIYACEMH
jgi:hypothetical protein